MGQSTDGILFFGYCWDEEATNPWSTSSGDEDVDGDSDEYAEDRFARVSNLRPNLEYMEKVRALEATGIIISSHCSGECPMPYVAIKESELKANRGGPVEVKSLDVDPTWVPKLNDFCKLMGINPPESQEPKWWLVSDWN